MRVQWLCRFKNTIENNWVCAPNAPRRLHGSARCFHNQLAARYCRSKNATQVYMYP